MCGIFGVVYRDPSRVEKATQFQRAVDLLQHRGPDDVGLQSHPGVVLGSRRLAILDLSPAGHMPMGTPDGRYWITYNGEIYNFAELRAQLVARGYTFRSRTDTEVLLQLFVDQGPAMLPQLNGMFAFAIWDAQERTLFAARDRMGVKPLCYAMHADALVFASEHKALFAAGVPRAFDHSKWNELMCFRFVAGEDTAFAGVRRLLPGHCLTFKNGQLQTRAWWRLRDAAEERRASLPADPVAWFREYLTASTRLRLISDVPVGVLLSGGLDSSTVAGVTAGETGSGVSSYTVRFPERGFDEGEFAKLVAVRWALDYQELFVPADALMDLTMEAAWLNDEPLAHGSDQHLLAIAKFAKPRSTVLLSGEGADETHGGYIRYQPLRFPRLLKLSRPVVPPFVRVNLAGARARKLGRFMSLKRLDDIVFFNACDVLPHELATLGLAPEADYPYRRQIHEESRQFYEGDLIRQAMYLDQHTFLCSLLDRNDRMTMGGSIECRVPFLDYRLVEMLAALPTSTLVHGSLPKALLRDAFSAILPPAVRGHRKWGFGVPWAQYLRERPEYRSRLADMPRHPLVLDSPLDPARVRQLVDRYLGGEEAAFPLVKQLFMLTSWHEAYFGRRAVPVEDPLMPALISQ